MSVEPASSAEKTGVHRSQAVESRSLKKGEKAVLYGEQTTQTCAKLVFVNCPRLGESLSHRRLVKIFLKSREERLHFFRRSQFAHCV